MIFFRSVEEQAGRIPDKIGKLRYLRTAALSRRERVRWIVVGAASCGLLFSYPKLRPLSTPPKIKPVRAEAAGNSPALQVFLVERKGGTDLYSNGLQVRNDYRSAGLPRHYRNFSRVGRVPSQPLSNPAGIVFHTTESLLLPIEPNQRAPLNRTREDLLAHARNGRLYNFIVDRFGQVFRVVPEDQTALHAGHSIWADEKSVYIDLNESFLGVSLEAGAGEEATTAQIHAARLLTEMLRSAYGIRDEDCVTHAQVSINPDNLRIGYHTDWAARFPFREIGIAGGYKSSVAAIEMFGFGYDEHFLAAIGGKPWEGLTTAEEEILRKAGSRGMTAGRYRGLLQQQFREIRRHTHERS